MGWSPFSPISIACGVMAAATALVAQPAICTLPSAAVALALGAAAAGALVRLHGDVGRLLLERRSALGRGHGVQRCIDMRGSGLVACCGRLARRRLGRAGGGFAGLVFAAGCKACTCVCARRSLGARTGTGQGVERRCVGRFAGATSAAVRRLGGSSLGRLGLARGLADGLAALAAGTGLAALADLPALVFAAPALPAGLPVALLLVLAAVAVVEAAVDFAAPLAPVLVPVLAPAFAFALVLPLPCSCSAVARVS